MGNSDPADPLREPQEPSPVHTSRLQLIWDVTVFQFKLAADGLRDLLLMPLSIGAAVMGLVAGGDDPARHFRRVLRFGRRSENWINLFGRKGRRGTSDEMVDTLRERVFTEATGNPWLNKAGTRLNATLDDMNARRTRGGPPETGS